MIWFCVFFFFQAEDGIRDHCVTGVQTCALPISAPGATSLPRIITPNANPALAADAGAAGYRIIGVEVGAAPSVTTAYSLVALGEGDKLQNSLDRVPRRIILDRLIVRGHDSLDVRRGVALNGAELAVIDSWIAGIHSKSDAA